MKLSKICIERPVFATVLSIALIIFGLIGFSELETRYFPKIPQNTAQVSVSYPGASASLMANEVTQNLENTLINIDGLTAIWSSSGNGSSNIYMNFADSVNMISAMGDVRDAVSGASDKLPSDINPPSISSGGVLRPVLNIGFMGKGLNQSKIRDYVSQNIVPPIYNLPGMGAVWLFGASTYALRIWLDPRKMAAYGVTVTDVQTKLQNNNIDFSAGSIRTPNRNYSLVANTSLRNVDQFKNLILREDTSGNVVRLSDVATVELGSQSLQASPMRINNVNAVDMEIRPLTSANPITVAAESKAELEKLRSKLPKGLEMKTTYDQSTFLKRAIDESFITLVEAIVLVMAVVLLFLGSLRAAVIPIITIPVCIIGVFAVMLLCGFSINVVTLLAIILAIGLVVDDAIVVLENIYRHIELKIKPMQAAKLGSKEIGFSVIGMTLTLAAVYAPSGFASGFSAAVFREFAFTLAGAVLISGFVALTLSPMMCSRFLKMTTEQSRYENGLERVFEYLNSHYQRFLAFMLRMRWGVVAAVCLLGVLGYGVYKVVPQSFIPKEDIGYFEASVTSPPGSSVEYSDRYMKQLEAILVKDPSIKYVASFVNSGGATEFITLSDWGKERHLNTEQVIEGLKAKVDKIPGIKVAFTIPDPISYSAESGGSDIQVNLMTLGDYKDLEQGVDKFYRKLENYPGMIDLNKDLKFDNQVYQVNFKREQAANLSVNLQDVADTMSILLSGKHITDILKGSQTFNVMVQMNLKDLSSFKSLNSIYVRSTNTITLPDGSTSPGMMVPLSNLVDITPAIQQTTIHHYQRMLSAKISGSIAPGYSMGQVVQHLQTLLPTMMGSKERYVFSGRIAAFLKSSGEMGGLFALSLIFIYLVLAVQFESFVDPFIILLSVPLCIVGALIVLYLSGGSLNLYSNIGLITLVGLITKHGILITQFANVRLKEGKALADAVISASVTRLRPILMTTMAMVLGALPLALQSGPGSNAHRQIGWVIVGGMLFGTFFSLAVVPVAYYLLARFDHKKKKLLLEREAEAGA